MTKKAVLVVMLAAAVASTLVQLHFRPLDLSEVRAWVAALSACRAVHPMAAWLAGFFLYVAVTALSLPVAMWLTLAIGALFGFWQGLLMVSFASSVGATLAFLGARWLFGATVQRRFGDRLRVINDGIARDGSFYLFALRLVPVLPFFVVNLLMGLTPMRVGRFYLVSQAGMLAGTVVYVNAGTRLAEIDSPAGILSPRLLLSFAALAVFPWAVRALVALTRRARIYRRWSRPRHFDRNLIVIGGGAAGLVSAYVAAAVRAKVTLIESAEMGGDCLNFGCIPSKALIRTAKLAHQMRKGDQYGLGAVAPDLSLRRIFARLGQVIAAVAPHDSVERYRAMGVDVIKGRARLTDPWTVEAAAPDGTIRTLTARAIILATGAAPLVPPLPGLEQVGHLTTDTLWQEFARREDPPGRLVILGGGPVGVELAQAFARLGSSVTLAEATPRLLTREDEEVSSYARAILEADGVTVLTGYKAMQCGKDGANKWLEADGPDGRMRLGFDDLIVAVGRTARIAGFGLEKLGIPASRVIETNEYLQTLYPNIFVAGDAAGPHQFTHAAAHQAWFASVNALFGFAWRFRTDYRNMPQVTFLDPEIARVGLNETEARARGIDFDVTRYDIADLDRAITEGAATGFVKVLTVPGRDRILGATIVGEHAGDILAEFVLAMRHRLGLGKILSTIHAYPTLAEANKFVAGEWRKAHLSPRLLTGLERLHRHRRGETP